VIDLRQYDFTPDIGVRSEVEPVRVTALHCVFIMRNKQNYKSQVEDEK
jgi:hypothetical protein